MRTVCYHLYTALTTFAAGMGQTQIVRAGRLVGVRMSWKAIAGAGGTFGGNASAMMNQNSVNDSVTNNPPRETFLASLYTWAGAGVASAAEGPFVPLNVPVRPGDLITINAGNSGAAAPASSHLAVDFYIMEA